MYGFLFSSYLYKDMMTTHNSGTAHCHGHPCLVNIWQPIWYSYRVVNNPGKYDFMVHDFKQADPICIKVLQIAVFDMIFVCFSLF